MKLPSSTYFSAGVYLVTFVDQGTIIIKDPSYDAESNSIQFTKISIDGIDNDDGTVAYLDCDHVKFIQQIGEKRFDFIRQMSTERATIQKVQSAIEFRRVIDQADQLGLIQKNSAIPYTRHGNISVPAPNSK